ncbi:Rieske (2Fe-2S) protein [Paracoccus spongiarum]|uniref:Rieske 2Fe-2S domain-containing protein n=1 Tax=Paracoccus spongiarum TaxID=3064387 RepID=A0ABT9J6S0_9RHOB|nr:Rieske 2Fe-2S domain-containing protein [Paracoccus sp. 2205BS29-5]MDP5305489.1 Rieske 2Fe-2S domain-containing protein [Paracoccus sp. 2205BS29-5]
MAWTDYSSAPAPGTVLCRTDEVTGVRAMTVSTERGDFPLLLLRAGTDWRAYVNACPHHFLPLDYRSDRLLSADGTMLLCTGHGARFDIHSGAAIDGADCGLDAVPVICRDGLILIAPIP